MTSELDNYAASLHRRDVSVYVQAALPPGLQSSRPYINPKKTDMAASNVSMSGTNLPMLPNFMSPPRIISTPSISVPKAYPRGPMDMPVPQSPFSSSPMLLNSLLLQPRSRPIAGSSGCPMVMRPRSDLISVPLSDRPPNTVKVEVTDVIDIQGRQSH